MGSTINAKPVDDTMYHPNSATADCIVDMLRKGEGGPFTSVFTGAKMPDGIIHMVDCNPAHAQFQYRPEALPKYAGSPSSECPSLREGPPQKGKIDENSSSHNSQRLSITLKPEATCCNCNKSHYEGLRLVCDKWGLRDIKMPERPCEKWALDPEAGVSLPESNSPLSTIVDNASLSKRGTIVPGQGIQLMENPVPLWKDTNGYWEPVKPRSCTNCKLYNDPICMKIGTHIGTRAQIWQREDLEGFQCIAALPKEERYNVITFIGCNKREENC